MFSRALLDLFKEKKKKVIKIKSGRSIQNSPKAWQNIHAFGLSDFLRASQKEKISLSF
jgi:hypothetical protein